MSNLFTAVSAEQQEIVAGGWYLSPYLPGYKRTTFNSSYLRRDSFQFGGTASGPLGSVAGGGQGSSEINTAARADLIDVQSRSFTAIGNNGLVSAT